MDDERAVLLQLQVNATAQLLLLLATLDTDDRDKALALVEMLRINTSEDPTTGEEELTEALMRDVHAGLWENETRWLKLAHVLRPLTEAERWGNEDG